MAGRGGHSESKIHEAIDASAKSVGLNSLKESQRQALVEFVKGRDVFVCLPTGVYATVCCHWFSIT